MKTADDILAYLRQSRERFAQLYSVRRIGIFGSAARGEAREDSDLDVLVEMSEPTFDRYMDLKFELEDAFGTSVDLVLSDTMKERLRPIIEQEVVYA
jgi:predicted nucleotidyltransferase